MAAPSANTSVTLAVVDLGSNGARCLISEVKDGARRTLFDQRESVKLGEGIFKSGVLTEAAMGRALAALKRFRAEADKHRVLSVRLVATAAVREANNRKEFARRVAKETGLRLDVISGTEEARLIALGVLDGVPDRQESLLIDIGGGSTEVSTVRGIEVRQGFSLPLGAIRLSEMFLRADPPKDKDLSLLREHVSDLLEDRLGDEIRQRRRVVLGTAGTIGAIADALADKGSPGEIQRKDLGKWTERLCRMSSGERAKVVEEKRADTILAGAVILHSVMEYLGLDSLQRSKKGLRDGLLIDLVSRIGMPLMHAEAQDKAMRQAVRAFGRRCEYREEHAEHVTALALSLFDQTHALHGLGPDKRALLFAAAMLHDVGMFVSSNKHHKHSGYLIENAELAGLTEEEKDVVANVARYHRKSHPRPKHPAYTALTDEDQQLVGKLAGILRVADALDRAHKRHVQFVTTKIDGKRVELTVHARSGADIELWAAGPKSELFEEALGVKLAFKVNAA